MQYMQYADAHVDLLCRSDNVQGRRQDFFQGVKGVLFRFPVGGKYPTWSSCVVKKRKNVRVKGDLLTIPENHWVMVRFSCVFFPNLMTTPDHNVLVRHNETRTLDQQSHDAQFSYVNAVPICMTTSASSNSRCLSPYFQ